MKALMLSYMIENRHTGDTLGVGGPGTYETAVRRARRRAREDGCAWWVWLYVGGVAERVVYVAEPETLALRG